MNKKKLIISLIVILGLVAISLGGFWLWNNTNASPEKPKPSPTESVNPNDVINEKWEKLQADEKYGEAVEKYSSYLNADESTYSENYEGNLTIPSLYVVGKYIDEGYFNKYFVSNFWETKDDRAPSSLESYLGDYITDEYKEKLTSTTTGEALENRIFVPDPSFNIPLGCAEDWTEEDCFVLPPTVNKVVLSDGNKTSVTLTAYVTMTINVQSPNNPLGRYTQQVRDYKIVFNVKNTNPSLDNLKFTDIKIDNVTALLDITNTDDTFEE